jgi:NTP pyrophosphatase (non-canonical NTP hydrolase)
MTEQLTDGVFAYSLREANLKRQKEWDPSDQIGPSYRGNEMAGEIGELLEKATALLILGSKITGLCNLIKKYDREHMGLRGSRVTMQELSEEFGDAQITLDLCAMTMGIDLELATRHKFNATSAKNNHVTRYI